MDLDLSLSLESPWTVYENYSGTKNNYQANLQKVFQIDSVQELIFMLNKTVYSSITGLFTNIENNNKLRIFNRPNPQTLQDIQNELVVIDAFCVFRKDITPAWEDPLNKFGGQIQLEIKAQYYQQINGFYVDLLLEILGASNPICQCVNGIRILDKLRGLPSNIRFDLWLSFNPKNQEYLSITTTLIQLINTILVEHNIQIDLKMISHS